MGAAIPGVTGLLHQPTGQVIDGSLRFSEESQNRMTRTMANGNRGKFTISCWLKPTDQEDYLYLMGVSSECSIYITNTRKLHADFYHPDGSTWAVLCDTNSVFRDPNAFYNLVISLDSSAGSSNADRFRVYVNGEQQIITFATYGSGTITGDVKHVNENGQTFQINSRPGQSYYNSFYLSQYNYIDGQALGPEYFGFTDPLTNTWRPKKFSGNYTLSTINDGTVWSSGAYTGTTPNSGYGVAEAFNGVGSPGAAFGSGVQWGFYPGTATLTLPKAITFTSDSDTFEIYSYHSSGSTGSITFTCSNGSVAPTLSVNGTNVIGSTTVSNPYSTFGSEITAITLVSSGSDWTAIAGIVVNGVVLVDGKNGEGINSFYLPMDGNSPIGQDKSGKGNDFTPVNFGGSVALDNPIVSGALPILNTTQGGTQAGVGVRTDSNYSNLVLALPLVGNTNDVSNQINSGSTTKAVASNGNATASSETSNLYSGSFKLDGSGDYITVTDSTELEPGTGDFCYEGWFRGANFTGAAYILFDSTQGTGVYFYTTSKKLYLYLGSSQVESTDCLQNDKWHHIAFVREGGTGKIFCDGVLVGSGSKSDSVAGGNLVIGASTGGGNALNGYVQDVRVYNGTSKYSGTIVGTQYFVPPSTSPDILPDTPSGVSGGSKLTKITDGAVSFDGSGDYLTVPYSSDFVLDGDFTIECFVYFISGSVMVDFTRSGSYTNAWQLYNQTPTFYGYSSGGNAFMTSDTPLSRGWNHLVVTRTISNNTARMFINGVQTASSTSFSHTYGNDTSNVLMVGAQSYSGPQAYFAGFISNLRVIKGTALYTSNFTPPSAPLTNVTNTKLLCCQSNVTSGAAAVSPNISGINDGTVWSSTVSGPTRVEDRVANAFNGSTSGPGAIPAYPGTLTFAPGFTGLTTVKIYGYYAGSGVTLHVNGSQQSPSSGAFTLTISTSTLDSIVWTAVDGFNYMRIDAIEVDSTVLIDPVVGPDDSNEAATNFNPFNTDINTVRGQETSYATFNPLIAPGGSDSQGSGGSFSDGNLTIKSGGTTGNYLLASCSPSIPLTGKYYFEFTTVSAINTDNNTIGIYNPESPIYSSGDYARINPSFSGSFTTTKKRSGTATNLAGSAGDFSGGDIVNIAIDSDNRSIWFGRNGVYYEGNPSLGTGASYTNLTAGVEYVVRSFVYNSGGTEAEGRINFGQKPFKFPPPDGFQPLNAANARPETVIARADQYVGIVTYTSNNSTLSVTDFKFQPDLLIFKNRDTANHWGWFDSVRGPNKWLRSSGTNNEVNTSGGGYGTGTMNSFDRFGFTLGDDVGANVTNYPSGDGHVVYGFRAGGNKNTFNVDNVGYSTYTDAPGLNEGTIKISGASVGTKQGFSIIKYTGNSTANSTLPHGLSEAPKFVIIKNLSNTYGWAILHTDVGTTGTTLDGSPEYYMMQFSTAARDDWSEDTIWNPTSTTVKIDQSGGANWVNNSNSDYIMYAWHSVPGLQKFGSYISNGNTDGNFVELGFKPALLMIKSAGYSATNTSWAMYTSDLYPNQYQNALFANKNSAEGVRGDGTSTGSMNQQAVDLLSNGFKLRNTGSETNEGSSYKYIYAAWAETPTFNLYGGQANAR